MSTLTPSQRMQLYRRKGARAHALRQFKRRNRYFRLHDDAAIIAAIATFTEDGK